MLSFNLLYVQLKQMFKSFLEVTLLNDSARYVCKNPQWTTDSQAPMSTYAPI